MWVQLCVSAWLSAAGANGQALTPPPAAAKGDAGAMLREKVAKLSELKSYAFEVLDDGAGGFGRRGGRGGGDAAGGGAPPAPPAPTPTAGKVEVGSKSVAFTRGETVAYRVDKKTVYKKGEAWELYVPFDFSSGGRGGGGQTGGGGAPPAGGGAGGGAPPAGGGAGAPPGGGDRSAMRDLMTVGTMANQTLPHELLASMPSKFRDVTCNEADGKATFTGALSDEAADELSGAKRVREMFAGRGGGPDGGAAGAAGGSTTITAKGTATIVFDAAGNPLQITIETTTTGPRGDTPRKQSYTLKEFGAVKVEVPKEAAAKLAG